MFGSGLGRVVVALLAIGLVACQRENAGAAAAQPASAGSANPLLGTWIAEPNGYIDSQGFAYCKVTPKMVFTPTTQIMFSATAQGATQVSYLVSGNTVYVSSSPSFADAPKYTILGPDEIMSNSLGSCKYARGS